MDKINIQIGNLTLSDILNGDNIYNYTITADSGSSFKFGTCICKRLEMELNNTHERLSDARFKADKVKITKNGKTIGIFYIDEFKKNGGKIKIVGYDKVSHMEKTFKYKSIKTPITLEKLMISTLGQCDITYNLGTFTNQNYVIHNIADLKGKTCRQVIEFCLDLCGSNGIINDSEQFELAKYSKIEDEVDINTVSTFAVHDEETYIVKNLLYKRSDLEFTQTNGSNKSIVLSSNNPLLKVCSTSKVQSILDRIDVNYVFYPLEIKIIDSKDYKIGDYLSFTYKDKEYLFYVNKLVVKNNHTKIITCVSTLTEEAAAEQLADSNIDVANGNVEYFFTDELMEVNFQECSNATDIYYSLHFTAENDGYFNVKVNDKHNRQFIYNAGSNTISSILKYKFKDSVNKFVIENLDPEKLDNFSLSILYKNCMILDEIDELDYPDNSQIEEETTTIPQVYMNNIYGLMTFTKDAELIVSSNFFNQITSKAGTEELVVKGSNASIYYDYKENGIDLIFEGKFNNRIRVTEEDMEETAYDKKSMSNFGTSDLYYKFKAPMKVGEILEYIIPLSSYDSTYTELERIKFVDNGKGVMYDDYLLQNIVSSMCQPLDLDWKIIMTDSEPIHGVLNNTAMFNNGNLDVIHYMDGRIVSNSKGADKTWVENNDIASLSELYTERNGIKYYAIGDINYARYYGQEFVPTQALFTYQNTNNTRFYTQCVYILYKTKETDLRY